MVSSKGIRKTVTQESNVNTYNSLPVDLLKLKIYITFNE